MIGSVKTFGMWRRKLHWLMSFAVIFESQVHSHLFFYLLLQPGATLMCYFYCADFHHAQSLWCAIFADLAPRGLSSRHLTSKECQWKLLIFQQCNKFHFSVFFSFLFFFSLLFLQQHFLLSQNIINTKHEMGIACLQLKWDRMNRDILKLNRQKSRCATFFFAVLENQVFFVSASISEALDGCRAIFVVLIFLCLFPYCMLPDVCCCC